MFKKIYNKYQFPLSMLCGFLLPIKLILAFIPLFPLVTLYILQFKDTKFQLKTFKGFLENLQTKKYDYKLVYTYFYIFIASTIISCTFGIDPLKSFKSFISLSLSSLVIIILKDTSFKYNPFTLILAVVSGVTISSFISNIIKIFYRLYDLGIPPKIFLGDVTQSGQISITLFLTLSGLYMLKSVKPDTFKLINNRNLKILFKISVISQVLTLLINMKRGPWAGVIIVALIYFAIFKKKIVLPFILSVCTVIFSVTPLRERLFQSYSDFVISGGRNIIWDIGFELASTYPLGIGVQNSSFLQKFSDEIPKQLKHFHSNFINILVETGWLSFSIYILWLWVLLKVFFIDSIHKKNIPLFLLSCGVLSSQFAGLVEYNFGDKEILLLLFFVIGVGCGVLKKEEVSDS